TRETSTVIVIRTAVGTGAIVLWLSIYACFLQCSWITVSRGHTIHLVSLSAKSLVIISILALRCPSHEGRLAHCFGLFQTEYRPGSATKLERISMRLHHVIEAQQFDAPTLTQLFQVTE